ncbi:MAG: O-antigen ligase family protein [Patescibacteria group bacterium]|jgi:O-antigen ligase/tetratricopeptide (TPR) repeat protein
MSAKTYLRILQGGLIASLLIVFFVFKDLLFPYITSKQLSFNVLMEFLLAIWLVFIMRFPEYRPKKSYVTWGLFAYFAAILASCAVSVNFTLSFWGNAERMLGFFHLIHFLIFYLILITVFRSWAEWRTLLLSSVVVSIFVSYIGLKGPEAYSTIGNTAYVSGYLIFNIFFSLILWLRSEHKGWRWLYAPGVLIMLLEFWSCHTSGAIIGLFASILLLFLLLGLTHKNKTLRRSALIIFIVAIIGVVGIFSQNQSAWFQQSFLRNLTTEKATFQTRLISWKGALADFKYHPWLGTGFGNYAIIFDAHFNSSFFNYSTSDTYFDRAHNNLIDITSTTGLVGLIAYLSIFAAVIYYLVKKFKTNGGYVGTDDAVSRKNLEIIFIIALLAAYFIQNLAVFDSLVTYIGLMIILGFIYWLTVGQATSEEDDESDNSISSKKSFLNLTSNWEWTVLVILLLLAYIFTSAYNLKPWRMFQETIQGYSEIINGNFPAGFIAYQAALVDTPLDHDARVTLVNLLTSNQQILKSLTEASAATDLNYVISLAEKNVAAGPRDSLGQMQLAQILDAAARFYSSDLTKFKNYSDQALQALERSIAASPGRAPIYFIKAQMLLVRSQVLSANGENTDALNTEALNVTKYAISLNPKYSEGYCRLAQFHSFLKDEINTWPPLTTCLDLGGVVYVNSASILANGLNHYANIKDYAHALMLAERLASLSGEDPQIWINLARLYFLSGENSKAEAAAQKAISMDKTLSQAWTDFKQKFGNSSSSSVSASSSPATGRK